MFDKSAGTKLYEVRVQLADHLELHGYLAPGMTESLATGLNGPGPFIELRDQSGHPVFIAKQQVTSIEPVKNGHKPLPQLVLSALENSNWHRVLRVSANADEETVKHAYHQLAKLYHPDNFAAGMPEEMRRYAKDMFARISQAYQQYQLLAAAA